MVAVKETVEQVKQLDVDQYKYGFTTDLEVDKAPKGLNEDIVRFISAKKGEPQWMLDWRLDAFRRWKTMDEPQWARVHYPKIDFNDSYYYAAPKKNAAPKTLDDVDPAILETYKKLGIPLREQEILAGVQTSKVAVDAVFDSVSVVTTFKEELKMHVNSVPAEESNISVSNQAIEQMDFKELVKLIQGLPSMTRTVFNLFVFDGYNHKEISEQLSISEGTSHWHVHQARNLLQEKIKKSEQQNLSYEAKRI